MEISLWQLNNIVKAAAREAVEQYIISQNPSSDEITARQAFKEFGEGWVKHQESVGLLEKPTRKGVHKNSPLVYSRSKLRELKFGINPLLQAVVK